MTLHEDIVTLFKSNKKTKFSLARERPDMQEYFKKTFPMLDYATEYRHIGYLMVHGLSEPKKCCCDGCSNYLKFSKTSSRYQTDVCSYTCSYANLVKTGKAAEMVKKREQTCMEIYGVKNPSSHPAIREKFRNTNIERRGVDNPLKCPLVKLKSEETSMVRYGETNPMKNEEVKQRNKTSRKLNDDAAWDF